MLRLLVVLASILCGCGDDGGTTPPGTDAGEDGGAESTTADIPWLADGQPPIAPPELTPCPDGWREVVADPPTCEPYPEPGPDACGAGEVHFPGEPGCAPVGSPCPAAGDFSDTLPSDVRVVYVRPAATGGDGTATLPYGSVAEFSLAGLPTGSVIALSRGTHDGTIRLVRGIVLHGACTADTIVSTSVPATMPEGVITLRDAGGEVRDLSVADSPRPGIWMTSGTMNGRADGVVVRRTALVGIAPTGTFQARSLVVRDVQPRAPDMAFGQGLVAEESVAVELERAILEENRDAGIVARGIGTSLTATQVVVRDTRAEESDLAGGRGITIRTGASATLTGVAIERNRDIGLVIGEPGTTASVSGIVVRDTDSRLSDGASGRGVNIEQGAVVDVARALVESNRQIAVYTSNVDNRVTLTDVVVRNTRSQETGGLGGRGIDVQLGAMTDITRALLENNRDIGVAVNRADAVATLTDVTIRGTLSQERDAFYGRALNVQLGASATVTRALFVDSRDSSVMASEPGTLLTLEDVAVRQTASQESDGTFGRGLNIQVGAAATVMRALFEESREGGVIVIAGAAALTASDLVIRDTRARDCETTTCPAEPMGHGLGAYDGATIGATRFEVRGSNLCGVHLSDGAEIDLSSGEVTQNAIGVCLQVDGFDASRLMSDVRYTDNETSIDTTDLPVPEVSGTSGVP